MNELNHIPLEEMLLMSFKASDEGNIGTCRRII